jgi:hypothetical protein
MVPLKQPELWIGLVEVRPVDREAYGAAGAFTNIVTWARDSDEFRRKAETIAATLDLYVAEIEDAEPLSDRIAKHSLSDEIEDMIQRAEFNPQAIVYGTFHRYPSDH